jgi:hypothetical protein
MEKDGRLVGHGAPADGRWSVCYLRQTAEWWTGHRMPKSYPFADACLTWPHVRISASSLARQRAVERARRHHTFRQQFTRMLCGRRACKLWSEHAPACRLVICMPNRISSLWARQALARRGPNSHGGVASLIGCARSDRRTGHTPGADRSSRDLADCRRQGNATVAARHGRSMMMVVVVVLLLHPPVAAARTPPTWGARCWMVMVISASHQTRRLLSSQHSQQSGTAKRLRSRRHAHAGPGRRPRAATLTRRASQARLACLHHPRLFPPVLDVIAISSTGPPSDTRSSAARSRASQRKLHHCRHRRAHGGR